MNSQIAKAIRLKTSPVAVFRADNKPKEALEFKKGVWGCVIAMLNAASKGKTACFNKENVVCMGGRAGLGIEKFKLGVIEYFLSDGSKGEKQGEFYKKTPKLAKEFIKNLPIIQTDKFVIFKPFDKLEKDETLQIIIMLVNPDQLSALITLANYDKETNENVKVLFGSGCAQSILYGLNSANLGDDVCYIGLSDPSARKFVPKDILSFTMSYKRFLEMESNAKGSFLDTKTWQTIVKRID
nr:DUF169 domain-containing protein [Campylobacter sp.]